MTFKIDCKKFDPKFYHHKISNDKVKLLTQETTKEHCYGNLHVKPKLIP